MSVNSVAAHVDALCLFIEALSYMRNLETNMCVYVCMHTHVCVKLGEMIGKET
jgi:hypothetical protein